MSASAQRDKGKLAGEHLPPVAVGCHVEVELVSQRRVCERLAFDIVPDDKADFSAGRVGAGINAIDWRARLCRAARE